MFWGSVKSTGYTLHSPGSPSLPLPYVTVCHHISNGLYHKFESPLVASWNMMAHAQKPDFVFRRNGRVHLNRPGGSVQSTTGSRCVRINGSNAGYTMFRGSVKGTGYPLHSPVSPSLPLPCVTMRHHISTGLYSPWICVNGLRKIAKQVRIIGVPVGIQRGRIGITSGALLLLPSSVVLHCFSNFLTYLFFRNVLS